MPTDGDDSTSFDPHRPLCSDGSCIGVIGPDGKCTACGSLASGEPAATSGFAEPEDEGDEAPIGDDNGASAFDPQRRLCSDESCIGVIGPGDCCTVCGKPAA